MKKTITFNQLKCLVEEGIEDKDKKEKIKELKKELEDLLQQDREEYERYQRFEDNSGYVTGARANKIRDGFAKREHDIRRKINDVKKQLKDLRMKKPVKEGDEVATNADIDYDDEDGQEPGIPQVVEPAIDDHLCEMIAEIANDYFDMNVDDYETRAIADEQLNSIYTSMRSLALKWLKAVKDSK